MKIRIQTPSVRDVFLVTDRAEAAALFAARLDRYHRDAPREEKEAAVAEFEAAGRGCYGDVVANLEY